MGAARSRKPRRRRIGQVSYYYHHGGWHIYYRDGLRQVRRRVADDEETARQVAAQTNAQLAVSAPTQFSFTPITVSDLRRRFLDHHEHVLRSSLATISRYRAATRHLENFVGQTCRVNLAAHEVQADEFARYLRTTKVTPNGHPKSVRRPLRDKGVRYILETCRSLYGYAAKKRHLPPYGENPFAGLGGKRCRIEDAKPVFIFDEETELAFFRAADDWSFPIHFTLAKTGMRPGELVHLLIEEVDFTDGWITIRNKPQLGWRTKTRRERSIPMDQAVSSVLRRVIGNRTAGPVFIRAKVDSSVGPLLGKDGKALARTLERRIARAEGDATTALSRQEAARIARAVWREVGALKTDLIRISFVKIAAQIGLDQVTCPKSWRHTFATLLQDANVDPLVRQITLGHSPTIGPESALGMTSIYTHTRSATLRREILRAISLWPRSVELGRQWGSTFDVPATQTEKTTA